jgi:hypothetical protein
MIEREEILKRIDKLQLLMLQVSPTLTCEWEVIAVEKIRDLFEKGILNGSAHMQFLNKIYNDYKFRKNIDDPTDIVILNHRKMDILFSEDKHDELMYKLRYDHLHHPMPYMNLDDDKFMVQQIKNDLKGLSVNFDYDTDIMRIRISKKPGDLVMVEHPFNDKDSFPAVINSSTLETATQWDKNHTHKITKPTRCEIKWHKQDDISIKGLSTITKYDINTNNVLFAENINT